MQGTTRSLAGELAENSRAGLVEGSCAEAARCLSPGNVCLQERVSDLFVFGVGLVCHAPRKGPGSNQIADPLFIMSFFFGVGLR